MNLTQEQLVEAGEYLKNDQIASLFETLLSDIDYKEENGNPLVFAIANLASRYNEVKRNIVSARITNEQKAIIAKAEITLSRLERGELDLDTL